MRHSLLIHGQRARLTSFAIVGRHLERELRALDWEVRFLAQDHHATRTPSIPLPDVYLFYGHPYDLVDAPGRVNAFLLPYDYARFVPGDRDLAARLNLMFDVVFVPSTFSADACRASGVTRPIVVCPHGVDAAVFRPGQASPGRRPDRFEFLNLGGAYERKGTDVLLRAYTRAFSVDDPVRLVIKAFSYENCRAWADAVLDRAMRQARAPEIVFEHGDARSVAAFYRRADVGVFPFRGEGFGLTILECLASGTPAIVTRSGGPRDFATEGVTWIPARARRRQGREEVEPDVEALVGLMRDAVRRGTPSDAERRRIAESVQGWTWRRSAEILDGTLRRTLEARSRRAGVRRTPPRRTVASADRRVAFAFHRTGSRSWQLTAHHVGRALEPRAASLTRHGWRDAPSDGTADTVVGQSGFALEAFRASLHARPEARRVLFRESGPLADVVTLVNRERARAALPPQPTRPFDLWRHRWETDLAHSILVPSEGTRRLFIESGCAPGKVRVVRPGITPAPLGRRHGRRGRPRILFSASDPFRKGALDLLEAWRRARLNGATLQIVASRDLLAASDVLAMLVRDPSIHFLPFQPQRRFLALLDAADLVVLPSLEDGFSFDVADAMARGIPAIVSDRAGVHELLTDGEDGWIVRAGQVDALAEALTRAVENPARRQATGDRARETARRWTWRRFRTAFADAVFA